jgi:predicted MFS family arabinose efflux permease
MSTSHPGRIVAVLCTAGTVCLTGFAAFPALLPLLRDEWGLRNTEAGLISAMFFGGYALAVPVLTSLTDRVDARRVYVCAAFVAAAGALGFALWARGLYTAVAMQALLGVGTAGTFMPGLKLLSDRVRDARQSRWVAFYTSSMTIGTSISLVLVSNVTAAAGWRTAFAAAAAGPALAGLLVAFGIPPRAPEPQPDGAPHWLDFRPVFRNTKVVGYILGYSAHCWELFGLRAWLVAFLTFSARLQPAAHPLPWTPATVIAAINLLGPAASILGNEMAVRYGRRSTILGIMTASAVMASLTGFTAGLPWAVVLAVMMIYFWVVLGDSAALHAGLVGAADPAQRGSALAMHSLLGFGAGAISPVVFGLVLDLAGGSGRVTAWGLAFASFAVVSVLGSLAARARI